MNDKNKSIYTYEIDYEKLSEAIVDAQIKANKIIETNKELDKVKVNNNLYLKECLNLEEIKDDDPLLKKIKINFINFLRTFKLSFISKDKIKGEFTLDVIIKNFGTHLINIFYVLLILIYIGFFYLFVTFVKNQKPLYGILYLICSIFCIKFIGIF